MAAWLILALLGASISLLFSAGAAFIFSTEGDAVGVGDQAPADMPWALGTMNWGTMAFFSLLSLIGVIGLFRWKMWGFFALFLSAIGSTIFAVMMGQGPLATVGTPLSIVVLFIALKVGGEHSGWDQLD